MTSVTGSGSSPATWVPLASPRATTVLAVPPGPLPTATPPSSDLMRNRPETPDGLRRLDVGIGAVEPAVELGGHDLEVGRFRHRLEQPPEGAELGANALGPARPLRRVPAPSAQLLCVITMPGAAWTASWTGSPDNPSAANAVSAIHRVIGPASALSA
jgi:hypothetical protein